MPGGPWRMLASAALVAAALAAPAAPSSLSGTTLRTEDRTAVLERALLVEINALRRGRGLVPLRRSAPLGRAAAAHSLAMARHGFFEHDSRDGSVFWRRIEGFCPSRDHGS